MRILLDTHLLLWAMAASRSLPRPSKLSCAIPGTRFTTVRRKDFCIDLDDLLEALQKSGFVELPITAVHAAGVSRLPMIHRDRFDRLARGAEHDRAVRGPATIRDPSGHDRCECRRRSPYESHSSTSSG